ncbi:MAG TPA: arylamine N-acetyltransferase [Gammaproteobacteria bacterium]
MLDLDAYFARIGYSGSRAPDEATLRALHRHHPEAIAFENLTTLAGRPVPLDLDSLHRKLVAEGRGGYCFEHNLLFGRVLEALGFEVTGLAARVLWRADDAGPPPEQAARPRTHMLLLVRCGDARYLADVGFGGLTLTAPLAFEPGVEQATPHEPFRIVREGEQFRLEARLGRRWRVLYQFDLVRQLPVDFEVLNHFVATHPSSHFRTTLMAARPEADRRYALLDNRLTVRFLEGGEERRALGSVEELRAALEREFRIEVPRDAATEEALRRVLAKA